MLRLRFAPVRRRALSGWRKSGGSRSSAGGHNRLHRRKGDPVRSVPAAFGLSTWRRQLVACALATLGAALLATGPAVASHGNADDASPNMLHVANLPPPPQFIEGPANETRVNSDLAFWQAGGVRGRHHDLLAQGNYDGFRLVDIKDPSDPEQVAVMECRANQGDVSFYKARNRLLLIQSIDRPQTSDNCATARDTGVSPGTNPITGLPGVFQTPGFEGLRIFDVTRPESPVHIASVPTACGSHTHTTIPDERDQQGVVYVSSYPLGGSVTPAESDFGGPRCTPPHAKISIVQIPDEDPANPIVKEQPLHADTLPYSGSTGAGGSLAVGCHDITAFRESRGSSSRNRRVAGAACLEEGQLWDISDPENPTTLTAHSHIRNPFVTPNGLFHTASFTYDGEIVLFTDEHQGGGAHGCDGPQDTRGNVWFYKNVPPGTEPVPLYGRYMIPRPQPASDICSLHNGNVIPVGDESDGYFGVSSLYQGGTTVFDFTGVQDNPEIVLPEGQQPAQAPPLVAGEVAYFDAKNDPPAPIGYDDVWSSYWHNDFVYASSGRVQAGRPGNRGLDVYMLLGRNGRLVDRDGNPAVGAGEEDAPGVKQFTARDFRYQNPQTQDTFQAVSHGR
jgi:hypothetical protein